MDNFSPKKGSKVGGWFVRQGSTIFGYLHVRPKTCSDRVPIYQNRHAHCPTRPLSVRVRVHGARLSCLYSGIHRVGVALGKFKPHMVLVLYAWEPGSLVLLMHIPAWMTSAKQGVGASRHVQLELEPH